jgi:hypothetical protein
VKDGTLTITLAPRGAAVFLLGAGAVDPPWAMVFVVVALALALAARGQTPVGTSSPSPPLIVCI